MSEPATESPASPRPRVNPWWLLGAALALFWAACLVVVLPRVLKPTAHPGEPADFNWQLLDLDGRPVPFQQFRGKPIFLNIWATWCPPCVREMPSIARLAGRPELKGVAFICVSADASGNTVKSFLEGKGWPMTVLRAEGAPKVFMTDAIPATFIIAPSGNIVSSAVGAKDWDDAETVSLLRELLAETPASH